MKHARRWALLPLVILLFLTGCSAPEPIEEEEVAVATAAPTATPTAKGWVPDPTVTPMDLGEYITPQPGARAPLIHPVDRAKLSFEPYTYDEPGGLGVGFEIPATWEQQLVGESAVTYYEPDNNKQSKEPIASSIDIAISVTSSAATLQDADAKITEVLNEMGKQYDNLQFSSRAQQRMKNLREMGVYVTFWIDAKPDGQETPITMRGRIHVVPVDRKLVLVRYVCPADYNTDYEDIYRRVRDTIRML